MKTFGIVLSMLVLVLSIAASAVAQAPPTELEGNFRVTDSRIELRWHVPSPPATPLSYNVYRKGPSDATFQLVNSPVNHQYNDDLITLHQTYEYYVTAMYAGNVESGGSNTVIVLAADSGGAVDSLPPQNLTGMFDDRGVVELDWLAPGPVSPLSYHVFRKLAGDPSFALLASAVESEFNDSTTTVGMTYQYYVTALYSGGTESGPSNVVDVFTSPDSLEDSTRVTLHFSTLPGHVALLGQPFQYDADVTADPPTPNICFSLQRSPAGMTIDPTTGVVAWTPTALGVFEVEVKARVCSGGEGEAEQEFHVMVVSGSPGNVSGSVRDSAGNPVSGVKIKMFDVSSGAFVLKAWTDSTGQYAFPFVSPGTYFMRADADLPQFEDQWFDGARLMANATPVVVAESADVIVNFTLRADHEAEHDFHLSGTVRDSNDAPVAGASVSAFRKGDDDPFHDLFDDNRNGHHERHLEDRVAVTDNNGTYTLLLSMGEYIVGAAKDSFGTQFWNGKRSPLEADRILLNRDTSGIDFRLAPSTGGTGSISGFIRSTIDSSGLESHVLGFMQDSAGHLTDAVVVGESDSTGAYALRHLPDGNYVVLAHDGHDFVPTFFSLSGGTPLAGSATPVHVAGSPVTGIDIFVHPDSSEGLNSVAGVVGTVSPGPAMAPGAASPLPGTIVNVLNGAAQSVGSSISGADGSYLIPGLSPGQYSVVFQKPGKATVVLPATVAYAGNAPTTTPLSADLQNSNGTEVLSMFGVQERWNLVSVPVDAPDMSKGFLFPTSVSQAFAFNNSYQAAGVLENGRGYWLRFPAAQTVVTSGTGTTSATIALNEGWNLIGSISAPVSASSLVTNPPGILHRLVFGYQGSYVAAATIAPGAGYWVKSSANGTLTIGSASAAQKTQPAATIALSRMNSVTVRDAGGRTQVLYFGSVTGGLDKQDFEMPPTPPEENFDVRFASQQMMESYSFGSNKKIELPILLQAAQAPLTITWSIKESGARYTLSYGGGRLDMQGNGSGTIGGAQERLALLVEPKAVPKEFALQQNYPNPFNPVTEIRFDLPASSIVTLKVYNLIGQEVATLLDHTELNSGSQSVAFDGKNIASGIYFYRLTAAQNGSTTPAFTAVRKMIMTK